MLYAHCTFVFVFDFFVFWEMCSLCNVMLVKLLMQFFALLLWDISALQPNTFNFGKSGVLCEHFWFVPTAWISVFQIFCCKYCFCPPFCCGVPQYMRFQMFDATFRHFKFTGSSSQLSTTLILVTTLPLHMCKKTFWFLFIFLEKLAFDLYLKFVFSSEKSYKQTERILFPALTALPMSVIYGEYNNVMSRVHIFNKNERNSGRCLLCPLFRKTFTHLRVHATWQMKRKQLLTDSDVVNSKFKQIISISLIILRKVWWFQESDSIHGTCFRFFRTPKFC